jgi:hypothetical protein
MDIHAEAARFYVDDKDLIPVELSMLPSFLKLIDLEYTHPTGSNDVNMLVAPDCGAMKRFARYLEGRVLATCVKKRGSGELREVSLKDIYNLAPHQNPANIFLFDDMADSGSTLKECADVLHIKYPQARIMAYVTHPKFSQDKYMRFARGGEWEHVFHKFYVTNSIPEVANKLRFLSPFQVIETEPVQFHNYMLQFRPQTLPRCFYKSLTIAVASTNSVKLNAVRFAFAQYFPFAASVNVVGIKCASGVNEQPIGQKETQLGALTRLNSIPHDVVDFSVSIESGAFLKRFSKTEYVDQAVIMVRNQFETSMCYTRATPIPAEAIKLSWATGYSKTAGCYIQQQFQLSSSDWQYTLGGTGRVDLIKQGVQACLGKMRVD